MLFTNLPERCRQPSWFSNTMNRSLFAFLSALVIVFLTVPALVGCRSISTNELAEALRQANIHCLVVEPDMTVTSPFDPGYTDKLLRLTRSNLEAIEALLEVEVPSTLAVFFVALEMPNIEVRDDGEGGFDIEGLRVPEHHGYRAFAMSSSEFLSVTIYCAPPGAMTTADGRQLSMTFDFDSSATIRHELTHVCASVAGLSGPTWFNEGLAEEFESMEIDAHGVLLVTPWPRSLRLAGDRHGPYSIDDVLEWDEDFGRVSSGEEQAFRLGRPLSHALLRFLLEHTPGKSMREKLECILATEPEEIRALETEWKAWMEALGSDESAVEADSGNGMSTSSPTNRTKAMSFFKFWKECAFS